MTLLEMTNEVLARCGEGYTSYSTRAKAALRAATAQAISSGLIPVAEIDGSIKVETKDDFNDRGSDEFKIDLSTSAAATDEVLHTEVMISQQQGNFYFTKVPSFDMLNHALHYRRLNLGSASSTFKEVLYFIDMPTLYVKLVQPLSGGDGLPYEELDFSYRILQIIMAVASFSTDNTQFNSFFNEKAQQIIIDIAAKNLVAEINR